VAVGAHTLGLLESMATYSLINILQKIKKSKNNNYLFAFFTFKFLFCVIEIGKKKKKKIHS
jgi:hypothetical protein